MEEYTEIERSLTIEKVIEDFDKEGFEISIKDAEEYLNNLYFLAKLVFDQQIKL